MALPYQVFIDTTEFVDFDGHDGHDRLALGIGQAIPFSAGEQARDPYLIESVIEALREIGDERARSFLVRCATLGALRVRRAAERALAQLEREIGHGAQ
ncbi:MAG: hypothetical protein N0A16_13490 [Blastocatellia bacterium]|nr:hypothetical protein [Blastocatellia bacterium]